VAASKAITAVMAIVAMDTTATATASPINCFRA
jgi:hypothetical protein